jgi:hypothetical protein
MKTTTNASLVTRRAIAGCKATAEEIQLHGSRMHGLAYVLDHEEGRLAIAGSLDGVFPDRAFPNAQDLAYGLQSLRQAAVLMRIFLHSMPPGAVPPGLVAAFDALPGRCLDSAAALLADVEAILAASAAVVALPSVTKRPAVQREPDHVSLTEDIRKRPAAIAIDDLAATMRYPAIARLLNERIENGCADMLPLRMATWTGDSCAYVHRLYRRATGQHAVVHAQSNA